MWQREEDQLFFIIIFLFVLKLLFFCLFVCFIFGYAGSSSLCGLSLVAKGRVYSNCDVQLSHCMASLVSEHGL